MKSFFYLSIIAALAINFTSCTSSAPIDLVNPMVGTDATGHTFPGATVPFGMVQLSPDTRLDTWEGCSGYHYMDSLIFGFSHTHLSGTGCLDYGDVLLMPTIGAPSVLNSEYSSVFCHKNERAEIGRAHV